MSRQATSLATLVLAAVAGGVGGCAKDTIKAPPPGLVDPLLANQYPQIVSLEGLGPYLYFSDLVVTPSTIERPMQITAPVRLAHDDYPVRVQYRFFFFGPDGRPLDRDPGWRQMRLEPRVQSFFEGNAMETSAVDWRLEVRPAR